jgi:predicted  nucleic acid-binding Zn-ribbon protein
MKVVEDCIKLLGTYKTNIMEQNSSIEVLNSKISDIEKTISNLEKKVQDNWTFMSEEVNDIYPAIKSINTEIMLIKNKICSSEH